MGFEYLGGGCYAATNDTHTFGTDALLLADFASPRGSERCCDLCSGNGIIPLLFFSKGYDKIVSFIEIQEDACQLISEGLKKSGKTGNGIIYNRDLKDVRDFMPANSFDIVTVNPPYFKVNTGKISDDPQKQLIRSELGCTIEDIAAAGAMLLRSGGRLCLCHRPERLSDVLFALKSCRLEPKRMRFVSTRHETAPWLFLLEARLDGAPSLKIEPPLAVSDKAEMARIYGEYATEQQNK